MTGRKPFAVVGAAIILILIVMVFVWKRKSEVSMLLVNGRIYTVNENMPRAEALAIDKGIIVGVGTTSELESRYQAQRVIDLHGRPVYPGFIDSHAHFESLGAALLNLDVAGATSTEEVQRLVGVEVMRRPAGSWIRGRGWDQNRWKVEVFPTRELLDAVAPKNPVYLMRIDGHAAWVNSRVLELAHVNSGTKDPDGGRIVRDRDGNPTGVFIDNAIRLLNDVLPEPGQPERLTSLNRALKECLRFGLTEVHDMGVDDEGIELYKGLIAEKKFPLRMYVALESVKDLWEKYRASGPVINAYDGRLTIRAIKLYADGALGSRGAALIEPYSDDPGNRGLTRTGERELQAVVRQAYDAGFQVCIHAIGDRANAIALNAYAAVLKTPGEDRRFRVEHAQVLDLTDIPRFRALGVLPMMQPTHCTSDMRWAEERLGPKRILGAYAWRSLLATGTIIPTGSDFPVESPNPLLGFYAAITRQDKNGWPDSGWHPEQRMTREEALKGMTIWSAFAGFQEHNLGSIEGGKWADLVVLTDDIMTIPPKQILSTSVVMSLIAGEVVYSAQDSVSSSSARDPSANE